MAEGWPTAPRRALAPPQRQMSRARQRSLFATPGDGSAETGAGVKMVMPNRAERDALFRRIDYNGNGMLSLAEIDKAVLELWPQFDHKRALMRAYQAADRNGDGMIRRREFRLLLKYIIYFDQMWEHFEEIDSNHDHRLSPAEFAAGCATMGIQLTRANAAAEFAMMDENGGGFILVRSPSVFCVPLDPSPNLSPIAPLRMTRQPPASASPRLRLTVKCTDAVSAVRRILPLVRPAPGAGGRRGAD